MGIMLCYDLVIISSSVAALLRVLFSDQYFGVRGLVRSGDQRRVLMVGPHLYSPSLCP